MARKQCSKECRQRTLSVKMQAEEDQRGSRVSLCRLCQNVEDTDALGERESLEVGFQTVILFQCQNKCLQQPLTKVVIFMKSSFCFAATIDQGCYFYEEFFSLSLRYFAVGPGWASVNRGVMMCDECCSIHRSLGRHISHIKHLQRGRWTPPVLEVSCPL